MTFAERMRYLREKRGLSQEQLADMLAIPRSSVTHYEAGTVDRLPRRERLEAIANFFEVSVDYLLGRSDSPSVTAKTVSPEESEFLRWLDENMEDADVFFYDFHKSPEEQKRQFIETMRALWEVEKKRGNIKPKE